MIRTLSALLSVLVLLPGGMRTYRSKEANIKSNAPAAEAKELGKRLDRYCGLFEEFYDELGLKKKNDNTLKVRLFASYDEYEEYYQRSGTALGNTPLAYFSRSLNSIVMYSDERDVALRAVVFHESSHQFLNRYTYDAPRWINEGLAEYFEGWKIPDDGPAQRRPHLFDLQLVQQALAKDSYLSPRELVEMPSETFVKFGEHYPELHDYLHYATAWSVVCYSLETSYEDDRDRMRRYLADLRDKGPNAKFEVDDWDRFTERWRAYVLKLDPERTDATDHFLVATGFRQNSDWKDAVAELELALEKDPSLPSARYWLGYCCKRMGNYPKAIEAFERVRTDDPDDSRAPYNLARIHLGIDRETAKPDPATALELAEAASRLASDENPLYLWLVAKCHLALDDSRQATRAAKKILKVVDDDDRAAWKERVDELLGEAR
jgi:tetratricopeptide (TPR) repeat protein